MDSRRLRELCGLSGNSQEVSYLKLSGCKVGLLINFNVPLLKDGIRRVVSGFPEAPRTLGSQR
jgi:hypothetical protein